MNPTQSDVLSGRGARFNRHPGNEYFRKIVEQQKTLYKTGTKKQKMIIAKAIVEAIHSKEPPGRFLKKCADTGQWEELSKRKAADKAAQAMAYAINGESLKLRRKELQLLRFYPSSQQPQGDDMSAASSQPADRPQVKSHSTSNHLIDNKSSSVAATYHGLADGEERVDGQLLSGNSNIQQQLIQLQQHRQSRTNTGPPPISDVNTLSDRDGSVPLPMQSQMLQLQHQQQLLLQTTFGNHPTSLPHHSSLELTRMLNQIQQLHQQQQQQQQQFLLQHQHGSSQHNNMIQPHLLTSLPASLPSSSPSSAPTLSLSAPSFSNQAALLPYGRYFTGSQHVTNNLLQNPVMQQPQSNQSDIHHDVQSMWGNLQNQSKNVARATAPQEVEQLLQSQRQSQLLLNPARRKPSNDDLLLQQQLQQPRPYPFPLPQWQTSQLRQRNSPDPHATKTNEPSE
mmetsp:Transcript_17231/g.27023  ORF Transcript_17231/g.27023 Transcript_17231/m.27023 type:complete len:452 (-) Transcript_17231:211-1566(-)|eukprot:CAMPEP_0201722142 /NCGR_PEP_ID=MMETSP0593-20130828/6602_1 /ASSEMBLY_ACC=CAM_ASM_000672 /TAXON_ID=267983 /ORGANISM="Skeletonema japonicum, Strain CCMP2506" /LENGTH=451 /DNA_ID=CAMNT_0048213059 /DNA_START=161 /DNA_END=1516 /DNA_ORIENTATION=+